MHTRKTLFDTFRFCMKVASVNKYMSHVQYHKLKGREK